MDEIRKELRNAGASEVLCGTWFLQDKEIAEEKKKPMIDIILKEEI